MNIIARRYSQFLVKENEEEGYIIDLATTSKGKLMGIENILKLGYWRDPGRLPNSTLAAIERIYKG